MRPWEIGRLTRWQIEVMLFGTEAKRAENARREMKGFPPMEDEGEQNEVRLPTEEEYVQGGMRLCGGTEEHWRSEWKRLQPEGK